MKRIWKFVLLIAVLFPAVAMANGWKDRDYASLSVFGGGSVKSAPLWYVSDTYGWGYWTVHPVYGMELSDHWRVNVEGIVGKYGFWPKKRKYSEVSTFAFGGTLMADWRFAHYKKNKIYFEFGGGFGGWNKTPQKHLVSTGLKGFIQYGIFTKIPLRDKVHLRIGTRFTHTSSVPDMHDCGANSYGLIFGIQKSI